MTVSCNIANISNSIAAISISGVTVKDKDEIAVSWTPIPNVLYPKPDGWITDMSIEYDALMQGATAPMTLSYTLNYRFLGVQVGDQAAFTKSYSDLVDKLILIINAIITNPAPYSGTIEMRLGNVDIGPKQDAAGNNFFGADFALQIKEMQN